MYQFALATMVILAIHLHNANRLHQSPRLCCLKIHATHRHAVPTQNATTGNASVLPSIKVTRTRDVDRNVRQTETVAVTEHACVANVSIRAQEPVARVLNAKLLITFRSVRVRMAILVILSAIVAKRRSRRLHPLVIHAIHHPAERIVFARTSTNMQCVHVYKVLLGRPLSVAQNALSVVNVHSLNHVSTKNA